MSVGSPACIPYQTEGCIGLPRDYMRLGGRHYLWPCFSPGRWLTKTLTYLLTLLFTADIQDKLLEILVKAADFDSYLQCIGWLSFGDILLENLINAYQPNRRRMIALMETTCSLCPTFRPASPCVAMLIHGDRRQFASCPRNTIETLHGCPETIAIFVTFRCMLDA